MDKLEKLAILKHPHLASVYAIEALTKVVDRNRGDKGDMPIKGVDYLTSEEIEEIITEILSRIPKPEDGYTPVRGVDYFDGTDGETPVKGIHYRDGVDGDDGKTPIKGKDYFTKEDKTEIAKAAAKLVEVPKTKDIHTEIDERMKSTYAPIKDLQDLIDFLKRGGYRGGGTASTGGVATFYNDTVNGIIDGSNKIFTVAHTINSPVFLSLGNSNYQAGVDYTTSGTTITFVTAPDSSLAGQPFWSAHT